MAVGIPGINLLNMALTIIAKQTLQYYQFLSRGINAVGQDITVYNAPVDLVGSWQPVPRNLYEIYGLDLQKDYFTFYSSNNILDIQRDISGDQVSFMGKRFQVESSNDWYQLDGWKGMLCVDLGPNYD
jgi:hypothetical protein